MGDIHKWLDEYYAKRPQLTPPEKSVLGYELGCCKAPMESMKAEIDRLRAELAERETEKAFGYGDKVVQCGAVGGRPAVFVRPAQIPGKVGESAEREHEDRHSLVPGEWYMTFPSDEQAETVQAALMNVITNPPRQAVPDGWDLWRDENGDIRLDDLKRDLHIIVPSYYAQCGDLWLKVVGGLLDAMLTAAPEARSEAETCKMCGGSGVNQLSPDPAVIGTATCSHCGGWGGGEHRPLLPVRTEAEIQAEALKKWAHRFHDLAFADVTGPRLLMAGLEAAASELEDEAARLREGV